MSRAPRIAVATTSELAAEAAAEVAADGGNAVDCAIAASMIAMNTQPGICSLAGGAFVSVWPTGLDPVTIDGGATIPGRDMDATYSPDEGVQVHMGYGGGMETVVGSGSVAVPGALAACCEAIDRFGHCSLETVMAPSVKACADGFPLPSACRHYLEFSGEPLFARSEDGRRALFDADGELRQTGERIVVPHLADTLAEIGAEGSRVFYAGHLAKAMVEHVRDGGGRLTAADLRDYRPEWRPALQVAFGDWTIAVNPPPAVGGAILGALLIMARDFVDTEAPTHGALMEHIVAAQAAALGYRKSHLDLSTDLTADAARLLELARSGALLRANYSGSTVHTSAVDDSGLACAITCSAGYGSGEMPAGTGLWLNNCLGELELNKRGIDVGPPGARLPSNMAPGVARSADSVLAFGSPGADRITTSLQQFLVHHLLTGADLDRANKTARVHVETATEELSVSIEGDIPELRVSMPVNRFAPCSMYFGGVGVARFDEPDLLTASADPRRIGGVFVGPG